MKKVIAGSIGLIMTIILLVGVNTNSSAQQQSASDDVVQYTHGQPWG